MEWTISVRYKSKVFRLRAVLEYESNQIQRIRVHGKTSTVLLENDYPLLKGSNSKKGVKWKIREGAFVPAGEDSARLLTDILSELEKRIKS